MPDAFDSDFDAFEDAPRLRQRVFDSVLTAARSLEPVTNAKHTLLLTDVDYADPDKRTRKEEKEAILRNQSLGRRLKGTWRLVDNATGLVVDQKQQTLANVPYFTDRGTFIQNGSEWMMRSQQRMKPGVYSRVKSNGEIESHVNTLPGHGFAHRYQLDPEKGVFYVHAAQAKMPLLPLLKAMGATRQEIEKAWGADIASLNAPHDTPDALNRLVAKFTTKVPAEADALTKQQALAQAVSSMKLDADVTRRTLQQPYDHLTKDAILAATSKLLAISRGTADVDDRDHMAYQTVFSPDDLFAERLRRDAGRVRQGLLWKASFQGNLKRLPPRALQRQIDSAYLTSGLGLNTEEVNALELIDKLSSITRTGEGALSSLDAVPDTARVVQPSHMGFLDPVRTPESEKAGLDLNFASGVRRGKDGRLYAKFRDMDDGKLRYKSPEDLADAVVAFAGEMDSKKPWVRAIDHGRLTWVRRDQVDYEQPYFERAFSPLSNMVPFKSGIKGQRLSMGSRFLTQALPLVHRESPLVQAATPEDPNVSFDEHYGNLTGVVRAQKAGRVISVSPDSVSVRYDDGTLGEHELYDRVPYNRKSLLTNVAQVRVGDAVKPGQVLASTNYTDEKGAAAVGVNARVAWMTDKGYNFEDAISISEGLANRLAAQTMYQHGLDVDEETRIGKKFYLGMFPSMYKRDLVDRLDEDGVIRPGEKVQYGDPLILAARRKEDVSNRVHKRKQRGYTDQTVIWDHGDPGVVSDVVKSPKGIQVIVSSDTTMKVADKLSTRMGLKGVVARIIPDAQMPVAEDGLPVEVMLNPLGVISRGNPGGFLESILGKVAAKRGQPYKVQDFKSNQDSVQFVMDELAKHGLKSTETLTDPDTGAKIKDVAVGNTYLLRLHHMSESKAGARSTGGYTSYDEPSKGGETGSKRVSLLDLTALLGHGAYNVLKDAGAVRGQKNEEYWLTFMQGHAPNKPRIPMVYRKFVADLQASGINVVSKGHALHLLAMTDRAVDHLAENREIKTGDTVHWDKGLKPVAGGLFDPTATGGHNSHRWSYYKLAEPMLNPTMEDPARILLGLTRQQLADTIAGRREINGHIGPEALKQALNAIDVDKAITVARQQISGGKRTYRDQAIRRLGYLLTAKKTGVHPGDWVLTKVPILPPAYRPVSTLGQTGLPMVSDSNYLYKALIDADQTLRKLKKVTDDVTAERQFTYDAFKAVTGLGEPAHPKLQQKNVKGLLASIFGDSPKYGTVNRKLLSTTVDVVGRGVIIPDRGLDMDEAGIPEDQAWELYKNFTARRLRRKGLPMAEALKQIEERTPVAKHEMLEEMRQRPAIVNRAPVLHRYGIMAFWPVLTPGTSVRLNPVVYKGLGADNDGNCVDYNTPITLHLNQRQLVQSDAGKQFLEKLRPLLPASGGIVSIVLKIGEVPRVGKPRRGKNKQLIYAIPIGVAITSYDHAKGAVVRMPVTHFTVDPKHKAVRVVSARGREVIVSDNESLALFDHETGLISKVAPEGSVGKWMPVVRREVSNGVNFTRELGWWYGALVADGWISRNTVGYAKNDAVKRYEFERIARTISPAFACHEYVSRKANTKFGRSVKLHLNGRTLREAVLPVVRRRGEGRSALYKSIPSELLHGGSRECLLGLFSGLMDGDCSFGWNTSRSHAARKRKQPFLRFNTSSAQLRDDLLQLGRYLNVRLAVTTNKARGRAKTSYTLNVSLSDMHVIASELTPTGRSCRKWVSEFIANGPYTDQRDVIPVSRPLLQSLFKSVKSTDKLYYTLNEVWHKGHTGRETALRIVQATHGCQHPHWIQFAMMALNPDVHWDAVKTVDCVSARDVFDLAVPGTKLFMINNGLVIYDTVQFHVPVDEKAREEAAERMLPSRNLVSSSDLKSILPGMTQEYQQGLYHLSTAKTGRPERTFRNARDVLDAWRRGEISAGDAVNVLT